jgi:Fe-S-cluster containining protein
MPKKRRKKPGTQGPRPSRRVPPETQQTNLRRFTTKAWAISARVLEQRRDRSAVLDLMGFFDWLGASNTDRIIKSRPALPCRAACTFCCHVGPDMPDLIPPEALRIAAFVRENNLISLANVQAHLRQVDLATKDLSDKERTERRLPCLFLDREHCTIYPVRPMRCRAQYSPDAGACERNYTGQRGTIPLLKEPALLYKSLKIGMRLGLEQLGLSSARLALRRAMAIALADTQITARWLDGEQVFKDAVLAEEADEARSLARFARQAKHQVRAEARQLHRVMAMLLENPGAWTDYSISGVVPPL